MSAVGRVELSATQMHRLCALAGAPPFLELPLAASSWVARLDGSRRALAEPAEVDESLTDLGLLVHGVPSVAVAEAVRAWGSAEEAVDVEMLVRWHGVPLRVVSRQRAAAGVVVAASARDGGPAELAVMPVERWWMELVRVPLVGPARCAPDDEAALPAVVEVGWETLLAAGRAVEIGRPDLVEVLVADAPGTVLGGLAPAELAPTDHRTAVRWMTHLATTELGRLHARRVVRRASGAAYGDVEWVLLPDGWRSVEPAVRDGWRMVRLTRRGPAEFPGQLALLESRGAA